MSSETIVHFNPRSRERTTDRITETWASITISIHAPARGDSFKRIFWGRSSSNFNPRSREGRPPGDSGFHPIGYFNPRSRQATRSEMILSTPACVFQSTLPRGATSREARGCISTLFQSTLRSGDSDKVSIAGMTEISIHAPAKGRLRFFYGSPGCEISIHAPAKGDQQVYEFAVPALISIHAPARSDPNVY